MARWHHWLDGHEFEWTLGVGDGQGGLACCNSWGRKELDMTERLKWTESRRSNQSILKEINPEYSLEGLMLKLRLQGFGPTNVNSPLIGKALMMGKIEVKRGRGWQREMFIQHYWLKGHELEQTLGDSGRQGGMACCSPRGPKELNMT